MFNTLFKSVDAQSYYKKDLADVDTLDAIATKELLLREGKAICEEQERLRLSTLVNYSARSIGS